MSRKNVTSDPDRGVAVNSGTDPQRPGSPPRTRPEERADGADEGSVPSDAFDATHQPPRPGRQDVEGGGGKTDPDDAL